MQGPEYEEILASLQAIVRRAYLLGRSDALKQVVEVLQADDTALKPLALMAPAENAAPSLPQEHSSAEAVPAATPQDSAHGPSDQAHPLEGQAHDQDRKDMGQAPEPETGPWWSRAPRAA